MSSVTRFSGWIQRCDKRAGSDKHRSSNGQDTLALDYTALICRALETIITDG
jgi:hypothetical protein